MVKTSSENVRKWRLKNPERQKQLVQHAMIQHDFMMLTDLDYRIHYKNKKISWVQRHRSELNKVATVNYIPAIRKNRYEVDRERILNNCKVKHHRKRSIVIWHYSNGTYSCNCCGLNDGKDFLEVDHIEGNGCKHRNEIGHGRIVEWLLRNNLPSGFQILCGSCNHASFRNGGICPHKTPIMNDPIYIPPDEINEKYIKRKLRSSLGITKPDSQNLN